MSEGIFAALLAFLDYADSELSEPQKHRLSREVHILAGKLQSLTPEMQTFDV